MIIMISGSTHTGKTALAQRLLERYSYPYLSIDHLKMGLIRSGQTDLTPCDNRELTPYLWSIVREIIKTAIENSQNLIIEGCYIPFDWKKDFDAEYLVHIRHVCLIMSERYVREKFTDIKRFASVIENRPEDEEMSADNLISENNENLEMCRKFGCEYILIDDKYEVNFEL